MLCNKSSPAHPQKCSEMMVGKGGGRAKPICSVVCAPGSADLRMEKNNYTTTAGERSEKGVVIWGGIRMGK